LFTGPIQRYLLPQLSGLNFVLDEALEGGVNESLNLDSHGKSWSSLILSLEIELPWRCTQWNKRLSCPGVILDGLAKALV